MLSSVAVRAAAGLAAATGEGAATCLCGACAGASGSDRASAKAVGAGAAPMSSGGVIGGVASVAGGTASSPSVEAAFGSAAAACGGDAGRGARADPGSPWATGRAIRGASGTSPSFSAHQIGTLIMTTSATLASAAICGRPQPARAGAARPPTGWAVPAPAPSNRRKASSIASSRRAGRGGGGSGNRVERWLSFAIGLPGVRSRLAPAGDRQARGGKLRDCPTGFQSNRGLADRRHHPPSRAMAEAVLAARTSWTNSER